MTGVAALSAVSIPGIAPAMPNTGDGAPGTGSIFDALLAALAPIASDPSGAPAQAAPQAMPPAPASASDAVSAQTVLPDAVASLEAALAASLPSLLPSEAQSDPLKPGTALPNPNMTDSTGLPPPPDGNLAPLQPRPGRSDQTGPNAPASTATPDASLVALAMIPPQLPPADDVQAAPLNTSAEDMTIGSASAEPGGSNPLPVIETNVAPQKDVSNAGAANPPLDSMAQPQPGKADATAIPAQGAMPLVLPQVGNAAVAALSLKGAPSPTAE